MNYKMYIQQYGLVIIVILSTIPSIIIRYVRPEIHFFFLVLCSGLAIFFSVVILIWAYEVYRWISHNH